MINFRVDHLNVFMEELVAKGISDIGERVSDEA